MRNNSQWALVHCCWICLYVNFTSDTILILKHWHSLGLVYGSFLDQIQENCSSSSTTKRNILIPIPIILTQGTNECFSTTKEIKWSLCQLIFVSLISWRSGSHHFSDWWLLKSIIFFVVVCPYSSATGYKIKNVYGILLTLDLISNP